MLFNLFDTGEKRNLENPTYSVSDSSNWMGATLKTSSLDVSEKTALGVPAIYQAVNLISSTIANLPLHLYKTDKDKQPVKAINDPLYRIVHDRANDVHTKSAFIKHLVWRALAGTRGRGIALILRNAAGRVAGFIPLDEALVEIKQRIEGGRLIRTYTYGGKVYQAGEIIDIAPTLEADGLNAVSVISLHRETIAGMIEAERYATALFANGGVPPLTLSGPAASPAANARASDQLSEVLQGGRDRKRKILPLPTGFELKNLGFDPSEQQLIELRRFNIGEVSRMFNIAPALLHDLSTGTYSNVEQQHLSFAQQTILPLIKLFEQEFNLKLFGEGSTKTDGGTAKRNTSNFVEFNLDALIRGDLKSRMEALGRAINSGIITPNEARELDNRPAMPGGEKLYIQGATVPLEDAGKNIPLPAPTGDTIDPIDPVDGDTKEGNDNED